MSKSAKPSLNANPFLRYAFEGKVEQICRLARTGHRWLEDDEWPFEPDEIVPPPRRRRQGGQKQPKPKSQLRTFADDPRLTKEERNEILAHADSLEKADAIFNEIIAKTPTDLADPLFGSVGKMREAIFAIGQLNPSLVLRRLATREATASRRDKTKTASDRTDEVIRELAKPFMERRSKWTPHRIAVEIRPAVNDRLKAEGLLAADKPLSAATIRRRLVAQTP